ncbi:hypothetical protein [Nocardia terpenica]|uniref:hypothetical protein n=1 Tax=Nocardia terpenica TaxID=455432 RepID=UPI0012FD4D6F|nr:hypothetical protein [Nocardia terpenica]
MVLDHRHHPGRPRRGRSPATGRVAAGLAGVPATTGLPGLPQRRTTHPRGHESGRAADRSGPSPATTTGQQCHHPRADRFTGLPLGPAGAPAHHRQAPGPTGVAAPAGLCGNEIPERAHATIRARPAA